MQPTLSSMKRMTKLRLPLQCIRSIVAAVAGAAALSCVGGVTDPNGALRVAASG